MIDLPGSVARRADRDLKRSGGTMSSSPQQFVREEIASANRHDALERAANDRTALAARAPRGPNVLTRAVHRLETSFGSLLRGRHDAIGTYRSVIELRGDLDVQAAPAARRRFARAVDHSADEL